MESFFQVPSSTRKSDNASIFGYVSNQQWCAMPSSMSFGDLNPNEFHLILAIYMAHIRRNGFDSFQTSSQDPSDQDSYDTILDGVFNDLVNYPNAYYTQLKVAFNINTVTQNMKIFLLHSKSVLPENYMPICDGTLNLMHLMALRARFFEKINSYDITCEGVSENKLLKFWEIIDTMIQEAFGDL